MLFIFLNIFLNFLTIIVFFFFFINFFKIKIKKINSFCYLKYLTKNNKLSNFGVYLILLLSYPIKTILIMLSEINTISKKTQKKRHKIFALFIIDKKFLFQEFQTILSELFLVIMFCERKFSFFSGFCYAFVVLFKSICSFYMNKIKNLENTHEELSVKDELELVVALIFVLQIQALIYNFAIKFHQQRTVSIIITSEVLRLSLISKTIAIGYLFEFFSRTFFNKKLIHARENCEFYQKIVLSSFEIFFYITTDRNISVSRKIILRYHIIRKFIEHSKDFFINIENFFRYKKTSMSVEKSIKTLTHEEFQNISDRVCVICRNDNEIFISKILPCNHVFHSKCLRAWLRKQYCCPICLKSIYLSSSDFSSIKNNNLILLNSKKKKLDLVLSSLGYLHNTRIKTYINKIKIPQIKPSINPNLVDVLFYFIFKSKNIPLNTEQKKKMVKLYKEIKNLKFAIGKTFFLR